MPFVLLCYVVAYLDRVNVSWIVTFAAASNADPEISVATEGGSETSVPDLYVEVDNFGAALAFPSYMGQRENLGASSDSSPGIRLAGYSISLRMNSSFPATKPRACSFPSSLSPTPEN